MSMQMSGVLDATLGGKRFPAAFNKSADGLVMKEVTVPVAKIGALTTRTDDNTGELTMAASHGITTGARLDLYWDGGSRRGVVVGTVSVNQVPIDLGDGDNLPVDETPITAMVPIEEAFNLVGNTAVALAAFGDNGGTFVFADGSNVEKHAIVLANLTGGNARIWHDEDGSTNPLAGDTITKVFFSHGSSANAGVMRSGALFN